MDHPHSSSNNHPHPHHDDDNGSDINEDAGYLSAGAYSPYTVAGGSTPPPPPARYHNHRSDHPFGDNAPRFANLLRKETELQLGNGGGLGKNKEKYRGEQHVIRVDNEGRPEERERLKGREEGGGGVYMTWEDLWVTVPDGKGGSRAILEGNSGFAEPGKVLAIMGPSGCGKTTLLDALAGRLASNARQLGTILVNGRRQSLAFGTSAYVTQDDILLTTLTVREAVYYSAQLQLPGTMPLADKIARADETIREMGLQDAADTRIGGGGGGGESCRGLSGGQKRRLSICLEILMRPWLLFMDEPTSGLDSAASFHVMSRIAGLARHGGRTVVVSVHQPGSEVFELFDQLCLLTYGKTVYFGPTHSAVEFFAKNGFPCPTLKNPADHYLRTINKDFEQGVEMGATGSVVSTSQAIDTLVRSYRESVYKQQAMKRVDELSQLQGPKLKRGSQSGFFNHCAVLTRRSTVNMYRDPGYYWMRFAIYLAIAICLGTLFYKLDHSYPSIEDRGSVLMFIAGYLTFMTIGGFPSFVEDMKIFGRERLNGHYGVAAYVVSHTLSSAPFIALVSVIPGVMTYYMVGLQPSIEHFAYFSLVLYLCMVLVESLMMMVASIVPDFLLGIITGAGIQGLMMLTGGFFRLPDDIPKPVWKYPFYHIAFHKYACQGFYKNEFLGLTFPNKAGYFPPIVTGIEIISDKFEMELHSKWVDLGVLVGMVVVYRILFFCFIKAGEKVRPMMRAVRSAPATQAVGVKETDSPLRS